MVQPLLDESSLRRSHRLYAVRAHLLERAGRLDQAHTAYATAAELATSMPEQRYLNGRADETAAPRRMRPPRESEG
jgi:predicted RNA polymerase sigma factor